MEKGMEWEVFMQTAFLEDFEEPILSRDDDEEEREKWAKIKDKIRGYEISIIRKGNKHGHDSWGWDGASGDIDDKIILFTENSNSLGVDKDDCVPNERLDWGKEIAQRLCEILNLLEKEK